MFIPLKGNETRSFNKEFWKNWGKAKLRDYQPYPQRNSRYSILPKPKYKFESRIKNTFNGQHFYYLDLKALFYRKQKQTKKQTNHEN